ncbi:MAG: ribonuclease P protein component [Bacilli bacterium]|nr:ribonuclease P protein component [Bacilli bacterium]
MNRKYSLKKTYEIEKLLKKKLSVGNKYYAIYYQITNEELPKIAISVSKKFKTAVKKNYEKRTIKEIVRNHLESLGNIKMLIVAKISVGDLTFSEKEVQLAYLIKRILRSKNEKTN